MENLWIFALGLFAQGLFTARALVQWLLSEKRHKVVNPTAFWILSLAASILFLTYGWLRKDFALMLGQLISYYVYVWNLGIKRVWAEFGNWRGLAVAVVSTLPVITLGLLLADWPEAYASLFQNEAIPRRLLFFGTFGQIVFSLRFPYQALYSARRKESLLPAGFWAISTAGAFIILIYGILRLDPVVILAQSFGLVTYIRNLMLIRKKHKNS